MTRRIVLVHVYPELLNLYADRGNIAVLTQRAQRRDIEVEVVRAHTGQPLPLDRAHLVLLGGGSDREQALVANELQGARQPFREAIERGTVVLAVCGGYQLLGRYYETADGERVPGLGVLDLVTRARRPRLIGNVALRWLERTQEPRTIVGFENHAGRTEHAHDPLAEVLAGAGNNGLDGQEGLRYKNVLGTYVHGPLLPKNPHVADHLLERALAASGQDAQLTPLDDGLEWAAHRVALQRALTERGGRR